MAAVDLGNRPIGEIGGMAAGGGPVESTSGSGPPGRAILVPLPGLSARPAESVRPTLSGEPAAPGDHAASADPTAPGDPTSPAGPAEGPGASAVLRVAGPVPSVGRGTFRYGIGRGAVLGRAGTLRRYRVAVERGAGVDVAEFGQAVDLALANPASWVASGRLRLQRVSAYDSSSFTVYLATAQTARRMCAVGYVDIRQNGKPYTSCRTPGKAIINLDRWQKSVDQYVELGVPLATYRRYVINHEVGHELGHRHERCPGPGRPAPVMMQQTLSLDGCMVNPWPYVKGERYTGPLR